MATKLPTIVNGVDVSKELREGVDIMSNKKKYPFKESILGMIPEGVSIDEGYMINIADSMDLDVSDIIKQWSEVFDSNCGSSKEALQKTIDERDETIDSLEEKIKNLINERDHYKKEANELPEDTKDVIKGYQLDNRVLKEEVNNLKEDLKDMGNKYEKAMEGNRQLNKDLSDMEDKYNNLCKEKRDYDSLAQEYDNSVKECVDLNNQRKKLRDENNSLKDSVCKLREDLEEQNKKIKYMEDNYISKQVAQEERKYAEIEIHNRINDTKDLIRAIHTISKFI